MLKTQPVTIYKSQCPYQAGTGIPRQENVGSNDLSGWQQHGKHIDDAGEGARLDQRSTKWTYAPSQCMVLLESAILAESRVRSVQLHSNTA